VRQDPIIFEDWKIGSSSYFTGQIWGVLDFGLTILLASISIYVSFVFSVFFLLFFWTFLLIFFGLIEVYIDQRDRSSSSRLLGFLSLTVIVVYSAEVFSFSTNLKLFVGFVLMLKFATLVILSYLNLFRGDMLVPNSESVSLVLNEHIERLAETDYAVETEEIYRRRILENGRSLVFVIFMGLTSTLILVLLDLFFESFGPYISFGVFLLGSFIFSYVAATWYTHEWISNRRKKAEEKVTDDTLFPEQLN
jgi:hypothetical protein